MFTSRATELITQVLLQLAVTFLTLYFPAVKILVVWPFLEFYIQCDGILWCVGIVFKSSNLHFQFQLIWIFSINEYDIEFIKCLGIFHLDINAIN
jgi:hypothetical protein